MLHHPIFLKENACCTWITRFPLVQATTVNMLKKMFNIGGGIEATAGWAPTGGGCKRAASPLPKILYLISGLFSLNLQ